MEGYFYVLNERDFNIYNEEHQEAPYRGGCLIFCIFKIMSLPPQGRLFDFLIIQNRKKQ
jgi:hypothetical protein